MIKVTKEQMEAVRLIRTEGRYTLENLINLKVCNGLGFMSRRKPINDMSMEQIVLAWRGHVEVEQEFISFDEAMKFSVDGKKVLFIDGNLKYELYPNHQIDKTWMAKYSLRNLVNGKFTIE